MSGSINKVILVGNLARDPEIKSFTNGGKVANMRLITSESWRDKNSGERKERVEGHNVVVANENLIPFVEKYLKKGTKVYVEGKLETRSWERNDGSQQKNYATEIVIRRFGGEISIMSQPSQRQGANDDQHQASGSQQGGQAAGNGNEPETDDIPF